MNKNFSLIDFEKIDFTIMVIDQSDFAAGECYETWEHRRHLAIQELIITNPLAGGYIKSQTNFDPFWLTKPAGKCFCCEGKAI